MRRRRAGARATRRRAPFQSRRIESAAERLPRGSNLPISPSATQTVGLEGSQPAPCSASIQPGSARSAATGVQEPQRSGKRTWSRLRAQAARGGAVGRQAADAECVTG